MRAHRHRTPDFWSSQCVPTGAVEIDWAHPLAQGLDFYAVWSDGAAADLTRANGSIVTTGAVALAAGARGVGATFSASNVAVQKAQAPTVYTLEALIQTPPGAANAPVIGYNQASDATSATYDHWLYLASGVLKFYTYDGGSNYLTGPTLAGGTIHHVAVTSTGSAQTLFVDGAAVATGAYGGGFTGYSSAWLCVGQNADQVGSGDPFGAFGGIVHYAAERSVALSPPQVAQLAAEPFAMLRPRFTPRRRSLLAVGRRQPLVFAMT